MAEEAVFNYLESTNRPYSANDIVLNLHKQWGKTGIQRALDALVAASKVIEKTYGKQKVYVVRQPDEDHAAAAEMMKEIDTKIDMLLPELKMAEDKFKATELQLKGLLSTVTIQQLKIEIESTKAEIAHMTEQLEKVSKDETPISPRKLKAIQNELAKSTKEYKTRKRICMDIVNTILEGYPKPKKTLFEELGIETDDMADFNIDELPK